MLYYADWTNGNLNQNSIGCLIPPVDKCQSSEYACPRPNSSRHIYQSLPADLPPTQMTEYEL